MKTTRRAVISWGRAPADAALAEFGPYPCDRGPLAGEIIERLTRPSQTAISLPSLLVITPRSTLKSSREVAIRPIISSERFM